VQSVCRARIPRPRIASQQETIMKEWGLYLWMADEDRRVHRARPALPVPALFAVPAALAALAVCAFAFLAA
jgi:hypothetical protein